MLDTNAYPIQFTPDVIRADILQPETRAAVNGFLASKPTSHQGCLVGALLQRLLIEPDCSCIDHDCDSALCESQNTEVNALSVSPVIKLNNVDRAVEYGSSNTQIPKYAEPFMKLHHDPVGKSLRTMASHFLVEGESTLHNLFHLSDMSVLVSAADPSLLPAEEFESTNWAGPLVTVFLSPCESRHAEMDQRHRLSNLTSEIYLFMQMTSDVANEVATPRYAHLS